MVKKKVTYRVFEIKNNELTKGATGLKDDLRDCLKGSKIEKRLILIKLKMNHHLLLRKLRY